MTEQRTATETASDWPIPPRDEHNRALVDRVAPPDWTNPEPADRYDLVVIGAGTAGLVSAAGAAGLGARVALVERHLLGGDCLNYGCVPSKAVIRAARAAHRPGFLGELYGGGAQPGPTALPDFGSVMRRMRRLRAEIAADDSAARFRDLGVDVFLGDGRFKGPDEVEVGGRRLRFRRAVIATGGRPAVPAISGLDEAGFMTNETVFSLTERPERLAVIGGGPIGCELAQAFRRLGSRVTLIQRASRLLPRDHPRASQRVRAQFVREGIDVRLESRVARVEGEGTARRLFVEDHGDPSPGGATEIDCDAMLVAAGRAPNVEGMGLEAAGVEYDDAGVLVDDRLRTSNGRIYACGDVASRFKFTHTADAQARIVIRNALFYGRARASELVVPWCTYTDPEVAHVGWHEGQARERGQDVVTLEVDLCEVHRALLDGEADGFACLHVDRKDGRILGATLVSAHAGEAIGEIALAMTAGVSIGQLADTIHPYPTQAEVWKKLADAYQRTRLTPRVERWFGRWFRFTRRVL
jgi:pyruvate/2-oxoglutarate dehydrogenase complex dihydrolipoamide dehydrogenase (E3) component